MKETSVTDRLTFLAEQFDVFDCSDNETLKQKIEGLKAIAFNPKLINTAKSTDFNGNHIEQKVLGILSTKVNEKERVLKKVSVCSDVFAAMIVADPTENKMYLQWMLNLFVRLLKNKEKDGIEMATRLVVEDLPQANKISLSSGVKVKCQQRLPVGMSLIFS